MVTQAECTAAVANGAEWYCLWCQRFYHASDETVVLDHDHSFDEPLCERCDADMMQAKTAYKHD